MTDLPKVYISREGAEQLRRYGEGWGALEAGVKPGGLIVDLVGERSGITLAVSAGIRQFDAKGTLPGGRTRVSVVRVKKRFPRNWNGN